MFQEPKYTLSEYVRQEVATADEWQQWQKVKDAAPPVTSTRPASPTAVVPYVHTTDDPSADFLRREELFTALVDRLREGLRSGCWKVSGRAGQPPIRHELEPEDWKTAAIDFDANRIGSYDRITISLAAAESNFEVLKRFVETACRVAGPPGRRLTKEVIDDLAQALCPDNYGGKLFGAAWDEAKIDPNWKKAGRPPKSVPE